MCGALARLRCALAPARAPALGVPAWVWSLEYEHAVTECARCGDVRRAPRRPDERNARACSRRAARADAANTRRHRARRPPPTVRAALRASCSRRWPRRSARCRGRRAGAGPDVDKRALSLLYYDAYCAAVWTSAHAEYLGCIQDLLGSRAATEALVRELMVPPPELYTVANMSHLAAPRRADRAHRLAALLLQVVAGAARHPDARDQRGVARLGDHAPRGPQGVRRRGARVHAVPRRGALRAQPGGPPGGAPARGASASCCCAPCACRRSRTSRRSCTRRPNASRRPIRLHLAATFCDRLRHARCHAAHAPPDGAAVRAAHGHARRLARGRDAPHGGRGRGHGRARESAAVAIKRHLVSEPRSRKKAESRASRHPKHEPEALSYSSSWLGGRSGPSA